MTSDEVRKLYWVDGLSSSQIGKIFKVSQWRVFSAMKKFGIKRRTPSQTLGIQFNRSPLSFSKKDSLSETERKLTSAGLMLYWAEGAKAKHGVVDFANSNSNMVEIFLLMLRTIYRVDEKRIRVFVYCYSNQDIDNILTFWSEKLNISKEQFTKPYIRNDFDPKQSGKMPYGLVHVRYNDKRLLEKFLNDIDIMVSTLLLSRGGRAVKYTGL